MFRQFAKTRDALKAYTKKNMKFAKDMTSLFVDKMEEEPKLKILLAELDADASAVQKAIWNKELSKFVKMKGAFKGNLAMIQAILMLRQCSKAVKDKLRSHNNFKAETKKNNCLLLLQQIRSIVSLQFEEKTNCFISSMDARRRLWIANSTRDIPQHHIDMECCFKKTGEDDMKSSSIDAGATLTRN